MDEFLKKIVGAFESAVERELPRAAVEIQAAMNKRDPIDKLIFLASMSMTVSAMVPQMTQAEKVLYDHILKQTQTVVMKVPTDAGKEAE